MNPVSGFKGFPRECVKFFAELKQNNQKSWFEQHAGEFEDHVMSPARDFVVEMGELLKGISPQVQADPRVNRSIFRIHRDTRFSRDKTPYKTHLAVFLWEGDRPRLECSGYYFHLEPPTLMLGVGIYTFPEPLLKAYRDSVVHPVHGPALVRAVEAVRQKGDYAIGGKYYKRVPREYDPEHENAEFLLYHGFYTGSETEVPEALYTPEILDFCFEKFKDMSPIHHWLLGVSQRASEGEVEDVGTA